MYSCTNLCFYLLFFTYLIVNYLSVRFFINKLRKIFLIFIYNITILHIICTYQFPYSFELQLLMCVVYFLFYSEFFCKSLLYYLFVLITNAPVIIVSTAIILVQTKIYIQSKVFHESTQVFLEFYVLLTLPHNPSPLSLLIHNVIHTSIHRHIQTTLNLCSVNQYN